MNLKKNFKPTAHHILLEMVKIDDKTKSGLVVPRSAQRKEQEGGQLAKVLRIGPTAFDDFNGPPWCEVGDIVFVRRYPGTKVYSPNFNTTDEDVGLLVVVNDEDILGVIDDDETEHCGDEIKHRVDVSAHMALVENI